MKITEILKDPNYTISFEVFPPKDSTLIEKVETACQKIASFGPSFISVTYGAGGGTSQYTLDLSQKIQKEHNVPVIAHLTCVSSTKSGVREQIEKIHQAGVKNILALRGDLTPELKAREVIPEYNHAVELVRELAASGHDFCVGAACYPETHPESKNSAEDIAHLKEKVEAGCDFLTTQMFFDNNMFYNFLYKIRESGITCPVIPGIMPITTARQIARSIELSGSFMPKSFLDLADRFGDTPEAMKQAGIIYASSQIIDLFANGIRHVHVYTMNNPEVASSILTHLSGIL